MRLRSVDAFIEFTKLKRILTIRYADVQRLGSGRAVFLRVRVADRVAVISVDEDGWLVELWRAEHSPPEEENLVEEMLINDPGEVTQHVCDWLDAAQ
jgi:hypothetical protein